MTLSISFYNGIKYTKDDFLKRDQDFFGNGVVKAEHFPYTLASTPDMTIQIGTGVAWVDGYRIENDAPITFTLQPPGDQPRIDIVQIGHDDFHACAVLEVKTGVPGHTESIPAADPKFVELYAIYVNPGVAGIAAEDVEKVASLVPLQVSGTQISFDGAVPSSEKGQPGGVASLDSTGKVPVGQIPVLDYVPTSEQGKPSGVATLDIAGLVPLAQLPPLDYVPTQYVGQPDGVASLDATGKVPVRQIPELGYVPTSTEGQPNGVATLGSDGKVPTAQLPPLDYIPMSQVGQSNGVSTLDGTGHVPSMQLPVAKEEVLGAVKQGANITIAPDGTISCAEPYTLQSATATQIGGIKVPSAVANTSVPVAATRVASVKDLQITTTSQTTLVQFTPQALNGNFVVYASFRVTGSLAVNVTVQTTYTSGTGTQTNTQWDQTVSPGDYSLIPLFFDATNSSPIVVSISAGVENFVYGSASIVGV